MATAVEAALGRFLAGRLRTVRRLPDLLRPTNTPMRLWWHGVGIGLAAIAVLVLSVLTLGSVRHDAELARDRFSPALSDALAARAALSDADRAAWASFGSGNAALVGPGSDYLNDVTVAGRHLEDLASLDIGNAGELSSVGGKLITYQSLVEQADASYRADVGLSDEPQHELAFAYLQYSSNTLRTADGGLLVTMDQVIKDIQGQSRAASGGPAVWIVVFAVAVAASIALWVRAQRYLWRAFRRSVNLPLLGAVALLLGLTGWLVAVTAHSSGNLGEVRDELRPSLMDQWETRTDDADHRSDALRDEVARTGAVLPEDASARAMSLTDITPLRDSVDTRLAAASATFGLPVGQYAVGIGALALVWLGIWLHLREYEGWRR